MKSLFITLGLITSMGAMAQDCASDIDTLLANISSEQTCLAAQSHASACAFGSSMDVDIAGAAQSRCSQLSAPLTKAESHKLQRMIKRCNTKYASKEGTMYISMAAFCRLDAVVKMSK